jgi:hypothetical protein
MEKVTNSLIQNNGKGNTQPDPKSLFPLFWIKLLVTLPIILDQTVDDCSHYFGSGC